MHGLRLLPMQAAVSEALIPGRGLKHGFDGFADFIVDIVSEALIPGRGLKRDKRPLLDYRLRKSARH